jgi:8-oxo-dGTP pyrophosphatase MutT (NUDIX family)
MQEVSWFARIFDVWTLLSLLRLYLIRSYQCWNFSLAVCQHPDGRYLLVQETEKHKKLWWLPGGRVEHGDSFLKTAMKETKEEGGVDVTPTRLLKVWFLVFSAYTCRLSKATAE